MAGFIVTCELHEQGQQHDCLTERLKHYESHWRIHASTWVIISSETVGEIRDRLQPCLDENDTLFVARLSGIAAWKGYSEDTTDWLKRHL